ncbi:MAG: PEGA domain-containing protein [Deltaproteobacteria bacterium]|nr:PEGA domain-containing protein [Deltaproteobacteria bacterium]
MVRSWINICLLAAFSLTLGVIWPDYSVAAQAPQLELLGQIKAGLRVPTRVEVDNSGNIFVADARLQQIFKFDKFGRQLLLLDQEQISGTGLAVSPAGDRIYASAFDKVAVFGGDGELLGYLGQGAGEFAAAGAIDLDSDGNIYVVDLNRRHVKVFRPQGDADGQLGAATFVANSSLVFRPATEQLYLTDSVVASTAGLEPKVTVYDRFGNLQKTILAKTGFGSGPVHFFGGMAFDAEDRFYVGDSEDMTIRVLDPVGTPLLTYRREGMSRPLSMVFDAVTSRLFVTQADHQIDIYGVDGGQNPVEVNHAPGTPVPLAPIAGSEVSSPRPLLRFSNAVDADETDTLSYRVRVFDAAQNLMTSLTVAEQPAVTSGLLNLDLQENGFYRWQVQAFDGQAESNWSELQSFYVNAVQEAPSIPLLIAPLAGAVVRTEALLEWQAASDADPADSISYLLEVAADADFSNLIFSEDLTATLRPLADWSALLEPGSNYFWRVWAVDNHGLKTVSRADGRFLYQASQLSVAVNMPGARVYLGGHQGYAGQFIGEAPVTLRDLPEGRYQLVVERAGFEPFLQPVDIQVVERSDVYAELRPAYLPTQLVFEPLRVAGKEVGSGTLLTPLVVDLDLDGIEDLLLTHADGSIHYHPGTLVGAPDPGAAVRQVRFQAEQPLVLPQLAGGTPCLVDWNNDYLQDLLIGTADGAVWLYLNQGDFNFSDIPVMLAAVGSSAVPTVADIDADGDKDLLVGSGDGELLLFSNQGTDAAPQLSAPQLLITFADAVAPSFADWDGDGRRELLIAVEGQVYHAVYRAGALTGMTQLEIEKGRADRLFALDLDGGPGKELVAGTVDGKLLIARSQGTDREYVADFYLALEDKLQQLKDALGTDAPISLPLLEPLFTTLGDRRLDELSQQLQALLVDLPEGTSAAAIALELAAILQ